MVSAAVYVYHVTQGTHMYNSETNPNKKPCFIPLVGTDCPEYCLGRLALQHAPESPYHPDGIMVQVCQNPDKRGADADTADYCGDGANVMTFYQTTPATDEQIKEVMEDWS